MSNEEDLNLLLDIDDLQSLSVLSRVPKLSMFFLFFHDYALFNIMHSVTNFSFYLIKKIPTSDLEFSVIFTHF